MRDSQNERETPLVQRLLSGLADHEVRVAGLLRLAKIVASSLDQSEAMAWINRELNGYGQTPPEEYPEYRMIRGSFVGRDEYGRWLPASFATPEIELQASTAPVKISVGAIEHDLADSDRDGHFSMHVGPANKSVLLQMFPGATDFRIDITSGQMYAIVDHVRNLLLDWAVSLRQAGVAGFGLEFSERERRQGAAVTQIFVQNAGVVGNVSDGATVTNYQTASLDIGAVRELLQLVEAESVSIPPQTQASMRPVMDELKSEIQKSTPDHNLTRQLLSSLRNICEGAVGSLVASGITARISLLLG